MGDPAVSFYTRIDYFDEGVAGHILNSVVSFVHKLEQFIDDSFEELPVGAEESRILTHDVHDIRRDDSLRQNWDIKSWFMLLSPPRGIP